MWVFIKNVLFYWCVNLILLDFVKARSILSMNIIPFLSLLYKMVGSPSKVFLIQNDFFITNKSVFEVSFSNLALYKM